MVRYRLKPAFNDGSLIVNGRVSLTDDCYYKVDNEDNDKGWSMNLTYEQLNEWYLKRTKIVEILYATEKVQINKKL